MADGAELILRGLQPAIQLAAPVTSFNQGVQDQNTLATQLLNNQLLQQRYSQSEQMNPLLMQEAQQNLALGSQNVSAGQMKLDQAKQGQLIRDMQTIATEALQMPGNARRQHILGRLKTVDFAGLDENELINEIGQLDDTQLEQSLRSMMSAQGEGQMSEYQRENLRLQEERLRQKEEQSGSISPYQQSQLDIRQRKLDLDAQELDLKKKQREIDLADAEDKKRLLAEKEEMSKQQAMERAALVSSDLDRAMNLAGTMTTGFLGARTKGIEGTESYDLAQVLDGIKSNIGFAELNAMRKSSPTGAALGSVTERELELLQRTVGSLEQQQSKEQFLYNTKRTKVLFDSIVNGTNSVIFTQKQYDSLPSGSTYIDPDDGRVYRKP